jgi:spore maturation protein CgeB
LFSFFNVKLNTLMIKSIFLVGDFSPDRLGASYQRAFDALDVRTYTFDMGEQRHRLSWLMRNRITHRLTIRSKVARKIASRDFNRCLEEAVLLSKAPALLVFKGEFVMPETLLRLRRKGVRVASFHPDNPFPPHPSQRPEALSAARETDLYLIWSERLVKKLSDAGVRNPVFLPFAWDPEVFPYQEGKPQGTWPGALFLGGWDKEREEFLEELACHIPVRIYGPGYWGARTARSGRVRRCWQGSDLRMTHAARIVRESAVCLNLLRTQHLIDGSPDALIMRHFEVPGAGGFLLSTRGAGATALFPEGETGEYFSDLSECVEKSRSYIANVPARRKLAERAHVSVASGHRYADRARKILQLLGECR